jgi:hypothetical protein
MKRRYLQGAFFLTFLFAAVFVFFIISENKVIDQTDKSSSITSQSEEVPKLMLPVLAESLGRDHASYHLKREGEYFKVQTVSQGLESEFGEKGVTFLRQNQSVTMRLLGADELEPANVSNNRIEYNRGNITEWYVNSPLGIEQGFTLNGMPEGKKAGHNVILHVGLEMDDGLNTQQSEDGNAINFVGSDNGNVLMTYSGLFAYDSSGKELPSEMRLMDSTIEISVDDRGADYPIVIDPFIEFQKILPSDAMPNIPPSWQFGGTVHISGNTAIVGAIHADGFLGEAYIFERDTMTNLWTEVDIVSGSTAAVGSFYGIACSVEESSGIAMVGANRAFAVEGRAYVYERDLMGKWNETPVLTPSGGMAGFEYGFKLNFQGDIAAVGALGGNRVYISKRHDDRAVE